MRKTTEKKLEKAKAFIQEGLPAPKACAKAGVSVATYYRAANRGLKTPITINYAPAYSLELALVENLLTAAVGIMAKIKGDART